MGTAIRLEDRTMSGGDALVLFTGFRHVDINHLPRAYMLEQYEEEERRLEQELAQEVATDESLTTCPLKGRACHYSNDAEQFIVDWVEAEGGLVPPARSIAATLGARNFTMQSDPKRKLSLRAVEHTLRRMRHEGLI